MPSTEPNAPSASTSALVTGGAGFIGSYLTEALLAAGKRVVVVDDISTGSLSNLAAVRHDPLLNIVHGSASDPDVIATLLPSADEVYHLAASVGVQRIADNPIESIECNIRPVQLLLGEMAKLRDEGRQQQVFLASSSEVYGKNPSGDWHENADLVFGSTDCARWSYGASKAIDEFLGLAYWRQYHLPVVIGRFFNVIGPRQRGDFGMVLPRFVERALAGRSPIVHDDGQQIRCFAAVRDIVRTVLALMATPAAVGGVYNIGSDRPVTIAELAGIVIRQIDPQLSIEYQSYREAYSDDFQDVRVRVPNLGKLRRTVDLAPEQDLELTVAEFIAWKKANS